MPAVRTQTHCVRSLQEPMPYRTVQAAYLESARDEFSLRKRMATYAPLSPPATPSPSPSPPSSPTSSRVPTRSKSTTTQKKKKSPNAFILYRSYVLAHSLLPANVTHQNDVSRRVAELWRSETDEVKRRFFQMAIEERERMESQGLLSHSYLAERGRKAETGSKPKSRRQVASTWTPSPTSSPKRRRFSSLSSPPPSPHTTPLPTTSSNQSEFLNLFSSESSPEKVPELLSESELSPVSPFNIDWSACSPCLGETFPAIYNDEPVATGPSFLEVDAWGAVRAFFDRHPHESRQNVGMSVSVETDTSDDLATMFASALDFSHSESIYGNPSNPQASTSMIYPTLDCCSTDLNQGMLPYARGSTSWFPSDVCDLSSS